MSATRITNVGQELRNELELHSLTTDQQVTISAVDLYLTTNKTENHIRLAPEDIDHQDVVWQQLDKLEYVNAYSSNDTLYGAVWLSNGVWLSRQEYDGLTFWRTHIKPEFPLNNQQLNNPF